MKYNDIIRIGKAIYSMLYSDSKIRKLVNNKIYPIVAYEAKSNNKEILRPYIIFKKTGSEYNETKTPGDWYDVNVQFSVMVVTDDYMQGIEIASTITDKLLTIEEQEIEGIEIQKITMTSCNEDYVNNCFVQQIYYNINLT